MIYVRKELNQFRKSLFSILKHYDSLVVSDAVLFYTPFQRLVSSIFLRLDPLRLDRPIKNYV